MKRIILILFFLTPIAASEKDILATFFKAVSTTPSVREKLQELATDDQVFLINDRMANLSLVRAYPGLYGAFSYVELGVLPTPVEPLVAMGEKLNLNSLYIKRDDQSALQGHFGGNKVRKLPFLLGDALAHKSPAIITMGAAGSNHALATADYGNSLGIPVHLFLIPQVRSGAIQRNLLWDFSCGADLNLCPTKELRDIMLIATMLNYKQTIGAYPYFIPAGGSCPLGTIGFVDAAFELGEQIKRGELPVAVR
jgi:D-cysteine desulfhydrase